MTLGTQHAVLADTVFDGESCHRDCAAVIEGAQISRIVPRRDLPTQISMVNLPAGKWLAPGFIDCQVNGGGDVLFNDSPSVESIEAIACAHRRFGTTSLLPTLITSPVETMHAALGAAEEAALQNPSILGIHLEGPFLSPEKPGVHDPALMRAPTPEDANFLCGPRKGVTLVTLAPERMPHGFISKITAAGVRVCLGHSMATYEETKAALAEGLAGFTHLFNAMRQLSGRDPGPIAAALETPGAWFGMIVDGKHVDPAMLRLALRGLAHPMLVTDGMPPVGGKKPSFVLNGEKINVRDGLCARADGTLAGAALDMASAVRNCVTLLGTPLTQALRYASLEPARFLGLGGKLGRLKPGYRADMTAFDPDSMHIHETWVAGSPSSA
ncbi:MAG: N-acetylglucosamine-6-phosphate deacetylase [Rhodomicrobium sp.]